MDGERNPARSWLGFVAIAAAPMGLVYLFLDQRPFLTGQLSRGQVIGRDFLNFWTGSRLLLTGKVVELFDPHAYRLAQLRIWGPSLGEHYYSYAPSLFPLTAWTGLMPYGAALALWSLAGVVVMLAAAWPYSRRPLVAAMVVASPAVMICLSVGQTGLMTAALIVGGLRLADRRPWLAGALIGLATFKPQLGVLIPVALVAAGRWRVIAGATLSALALAAAGWLADGGQGWTLYVTRTLPFQAMVVAHAHGMWQAMAASPFVALVAAGAPQRIASAVQATITLACVGLVFWRFWRLRATRRAVDSIDILVLVTAGFLASPYVLNYDMATVSLALVVASLERPELEDAARWRIGLAVLWIAPLVMMMVGVAGLAANRPWPPAGPVLVAAGLWLVWTAARPTPIAGTDALLPVA